MKTINSLLLLENLKDQTREIILQAEQLQNIPVEALEKVPSPDKWSAAQVLEHLNIYCRYYFDAIENKLHRNQTGTAVYFTPGWLGNYFTKLMQPDPDGLIKKKMKSPVNATPEAAPNAKKMLNEFIRHQHRLLNLLQAAKQHDLNKNRIPTSISKLISLQLGDTFRFVVAHQQRHFIQIRHTVELAGTGQLKKLHFAV